MSFKIYKNTIIYFPLVPNVSTGGPEAIHRLAYFLRTEHSLNIEIFYYPKTNKYPVHEEYIKYNNKFTDNIIDNEENVLFLPDFVKHLTLKNDYQKIQKCIWWLSVDFFYTGIFENIYGYHKFKFINNKVSFINYLNKYLPFIKHTDLANECLKKLQKLDINNLDIIKDVNMHFCQSYYSFQWLEKFNIKNKAMLTDFFDHDILNIDFFNYKKENIIVYNPSKGISFTRHLINKYKNFKFIPIRNLTKEGVIDLLKKSKIYIDFGNHPGRDRLPREAALCGCCIITGKRGSAKFYEDVPIPDRYKFNETYMDLVNIQTLMNDIILNYDVHINEFQDYRNFCKQINIITISQIHNIIENTKEFHD
jgi:hypothetical protein